MDFCKISCDRALKLTPTHKISEGTLLSHAGTRLCRVTVIIKYTFVVGCIVKLCAMIVKEVYPWACKRFFAAPISQQAKTESSQGLPENSNSTSISSPTSAEDRNPGKDAAASFAVQDTLAAAKAQVALDPLQASTDQAHTATSQEYAIVVKVGAEDIARKKESEDQIQRAAKAQLECEGARGVYTENPPENLILLRKVRQLFLEDQQTEPSAWSSKAIEVDAYIQNTLMCFESGEAVPLPHFFHATGRKDDPAKNKISYILIIKDGWIKPNDALRGYGAYASTYDEASEQGFGLFSFAIDEREIYSHSGLYFDGRRRKLPEEIYDALWVRTEFASLKITDKTVAYMVVEDATARTVMEHRLRQENLKVGFPILTREASRYITHLFDRAGKKHHIPENWKLLDADELDGIIPENVIPPKNPGKVYVR